MGIFTKKKLEEKIILESITYPIEKDIKRVLRLITPIETVNLTIFEGRITIERLGLEILANELKLAEKIDKKIVGMKYDF